MISMIYHKKMKILIHYLQVKIKYTEKTEIASLI